MSRQVTLIVLDSVGIGEAADAAAFGDTGSDTLGHIAETAFENADLGAGRIIFGKRRDQLEQLASPPVVEPARGNCLPVLRQPGEYIMAEPSGKIVLARLQFGIPVRHGQTSFASLTPVNCQR